MRSRHTGHVGSSISEGVGGAKGLVVRVDAAEDDCAVGTPLVVADTETSVLKLEGVKGSFVMSGNDEVPGRRFDVRNSTDLMKTT